jgi:hypothetical protein
MKHAPKSIDQIRDQLGASTQSVERLVARLDAALNAVASGGEGTELTIPTGAAASSTESALTEIVARINSLSGGMRTATQHRGAESVGSRTAQLASIERLLADAQKDAKLLRRGYKQELANADEWERRAMLGVRSNDDELAQAALQNRAQHTRLAGQLEHDLKSLEAILEVLEPLVAQLRA